MPLVEFDVKPKDMPGGKYSAANVNAFVFINFVNQVRFNSYFGPDATIHSMLSYLDDTRRERMKFFKEQAKKDLQQKIEDAEGVLLDALSNDPDAYIEGNSDISREDNISDREHVLFEKLATQALDANKSDCDVLSFMFKSNAECVAILAQSFGKVFNYKEFKDFEGWVKEELGIPSIKPDNVEDAVYEKIKEGFGALMKLTKVMSDKLQSEHVTVFSAIQTLSNLQKPQYEDSDDDSYPHMVMMILPNNGYLSF